MGTTRRAKAAETEAALKQAARRVFAERGYLNTKITDITAAAGRSAGSFYNHFSGKDQLLESLLKDLLAEVDETVLERGELGPYGEHDADLSRIESVRWHVAMSWHFYKEHLPEMIAVKQAAMVDPELGRRLQRILDADAEHLLGHLDALPDPKPDPRLQITAINALIEGFAYTWLVVNPSLGLTIEDEEAVSVLASLLHHGLAGAPPG